MVCPKCRSENVLIINSRPRGDTVRRRRECENCSERWTTLEISMEEYQLLTYAFKKSKRTLIQLRDELNAVLEEITDD